LPFCCGFTALYAKSIFLKIAKRHPLRVLILPLICLCLLTACASKDAVGDNGGLLGLAPSGNAASGAASILGSIAGTPAAKQLDARDKTISADAINAALQTSEPGKTTTWRNADTGHFGEITPGPLYSVNDYSCRDYVHHLTIGDSQQTVRASACRQPDGTWRALL
jgi:surface antigen